MVVLVTCKNEEDPIKNEEWPHGYMAIFRRSRADNPIVNGGIWQKFELIQAFMHVLITCRNEEDSIKKEGARMTTTYLRLYVYGDFSRRSKAANSAVRCRIWPKFELCQDFMVVLVTCKNDEDPIKNEGARVTTRFSPL